MTGILEQLKWESLKKRRKDNRLMFLYKGLKGKARIPTDYLVPKNRRCRNQHSMAFQIPSVSVEAYKCGFFPQTIKDCQRSCETQLVQFFHDMVSNLDRALNPGHRQTDVIIMNFARPLTRYHTGGYCTN